MESSLSDFWYAFKGYDLFGGCWSLGHDFNQSLFPVLSFLCSQAAKIRTSFLYQVFPSLFLSYHKLKNNGASMYRNRETERNLSFFNFLNLGGWRDGSVVKHLLQRTWVRFPAPTWQLIATYNSRCQVLGDPICSDFLEFQTWTWCIHKYAGKSSIQKNKINLITMANSPCALFCHMGDTV